MTTREDGRTLVEGWIVLLGWIQKRIVVSPGEGEEMYSTTIEYGTGYHRMRHNADRHILEVVPYCTSPLFDELQMRITQAVALEESIAVSLGAVRCANCDWN